MLRTRSAPALEAGPEILQIAREVLRTEGRALDAVSHRLDDAFATAARLVYDCTGCAIVTGMGKAGIIGQKVSATLASTGTPAHFIHPADAVHGDLGRIVAGDVVLAFSNSGETAELTRILKPIKHIGAALVAVTGRGNGALARAADVAIVYGEVEEACPIQLAPSTSCAVMMAIGDALAFVLMRMRSFSNEEFGRYHPGGSLGRKLQTVDDVMRTGPQLRIADSRLTVREAFVRVQRPGRRTGAVLLVDPAGKLEGLFTDSDLARLVERRDFAAFEAPIANYMTRQPLTLHTGQRIIDAVNIVRNHQVSEIPVLGAAGEPIGMIDITDLVDLLPEAA